MATLILIDNSLQSRAGHYLNYDQSIYRCVIARGDHCRILARIDVSPQVESLIPVEPVFRYDFHQGFHSTFWSRSPRIALIYDFLKANFEFYKDLERSVAALEDDDTILMPAVNHRQLLGWTLWLQKVKPLRKGQIVLLSRLNYVDVEDPNWGKPQRIMARWAHSALAKSAYVGAVRLTTDSERLASEFSALTELKYEVLPIPHTEHIVTNVPSAIPDKERGLTRFISLGDARDEKGYGFLVDAILQILKGNLVPDAEFVIQSHISGPTHFEMESKVQALKAAAGPRLRVLTEPLSADDYGNLLDSADVVLLPYKRRTYFSRTSGPFTEALARGKAVVVTDNTWMSDQLKQFGVGWTFENECFEQFLVAVKAAVAEVDAQKGRAEQMGTLWKKVHNPESFVTAVMGEKFEPPSSSVPSV